MTGWLFGPRCAVLAPLGEILVRAYSLAILPYLIFEVIGVFGGLRRESLLLLVRNGGLAILCMMLIGAASVVLLPLMLPPLLSSPLFDPALLESLPAPSLLDTFLPSNIFAALAAGNVPAVIIFSTLIGIILQSMKNRQPILDLVSPLRRLFTEILGIVAKKIAPFGVFAFTATAIGSSGGGDLQRLLGLAAMMFTAFVVVGLVILPGVILSLTRYTPGQIWRVVRDPLVLVLTTGNILLALPVFLESLKKVLIEEDGEESGGKGDFAAIEAVAPICLTMLGIGRIVVLVFIPFAAWFHDSPMSTAQILDLLPAAVASSAAGNQTAILQALPRAGLPANLISIYLVNTQWIFRFSDPLSLLGMTVIAFVLYGSMTGRLRFHPMRAAAFLLVAAGVSTALGLFFYSALATTLTGSSHSRELILSRRSLLDLPAPTLLSASAVSPPSIVTLKAIKARGVLRAGVRPDTAPWVYRNAENELVGFDIDLLKAYAASLGVSLEIVEGDDSTLLTWLIEARIDCAAGGIHGTGIPSGGTPQTITYAQATLAVVVSDGMLREFQKSLDPREPATLRIAYRGPWIISSELKRGIDLRLGAGSSERKISFNRIVENSEFLDRPGTKFSALLNSAEAGAAFAVLNPQTTMLPIFGKDLSSDVVLLFSTQDRDLLEYTTDWIHEGDNLDLLEQLRNHWILFKPVPEA